MNLFVTAFNPETGCELMDLVVELDTYDDFAIIGVDWSYDPRNEMLTRPEEARFYADIEAWIQANKPKSWIKEQLETQVKSQLDAMPWVVDMIKNEQDLAAIEHAEETRWEAQDERN